MLPADRRRWIRSVLGFTLLLGVFAAAAQLAGVTGTRGMAPGTRIDFTASDHWMVQLPHGTNDEFRGAARSLGRGVGSSKLATSGELPGGWYEVTLPNEVSATMAEQRFEAAGATDVEAVVPRVPYDEPQSVSDPASAFAGTTSFRDSLRAGTMRASRLEEQWAIEQPSDVDIDGREAWGATTGSGTIVAVIDTGVDATHPDLKGRVLPGHDFSGAETGATYDAIGHGTSVASIIAAGGGGMAGVAPDARIMPLKVYADSEGAFSMSGYVQAIHYAADNGAKVINLSLGCGGYTACYSQIELDALTYAANKGVVVVAAAGNGDRSGNGMNNDGASTPDYPSGYELPNIIAVTASTRLGNWATWSNYGQANVDLAAPGESILAAAAGGGYVTRTGTSFSAPYVAGAAALISASTAGIGPADVRQRLLAAVTPISELATRSVSGGTLNADAALANVTAGGAAGIVTPTTSAPRAGARLAAPPALSWKLPAGWSSARVLVMGAGVNLSVPVAAGARSLAQPAAAWRSGAYAWRVVARSPRGQSIGTPWSRYTVAPRLGAWVTSGAITGHGHELRLRVGYASTELTAHTRVTVVAGGRTIHRGGSVVRREHVKGTGSPRRGWFSYTLHSTPTLHAGAKVTVIVEVTSGGRSLTRRFAARVA